MLYTYTIFVVCCSVLLTLLTYMVLLPVYVSVRGKHVHTLSTYTPISCCVCQRWPYIMYLHGTIQR